MARFLTLNDVDVAAKTVLVRADLNVPTDGDQITDTTRLDRLLPTLHRLSDAGARVAVLSHFGRPKGKAVPEMSLRPVADALGGLLGREVAFAADCIGTEARAGIDFLPAGGVIVLENTRFHPGVEANDPGLSADMATLGDLYVNDAFSAAHRAHARPKASPTTCPPSPGWPWRPSCPTSAPRWISRADRWPPSSAEPRAPPRSTCSAIW